MKIIVHIINQKHRADHDAEIEVSNGFASMATEQQSREVSQVLGHKNWNAISYRKDGVPLAGACPLPLAPRSTPPRRKSEPVWTDRLPRGTVRFSSHT